MVSRLGLLCGACTWLLFASYGCSSANDEQDNSFGTDTPPRRNRPEVGGSSSGGGTGSGGLPQPSSSASSSSSGNSQGTIPARCTRLTPKRWNNYYTTETGPLMTSFYTDVDVGGHQVVDLRFTYLEDTPTGEALPLSLGTVFPYADSVALIDENNSYALIAESGTLTLHSYDVTTGSVHATLHDLTLVEVQFSETEGEPPTAVENGRCFGLEQAEINILHDPPPAWSCHVTYYRDGMCDCGCGAVDADCASAAISTCEYCGFCPGTTGSERGDACAPFLQPGNNSTCR